jgi:hypothetical protein
LFWLLNKFITNAKTAAGFVYFAILLMFTRLLVPNLSSPSSDPLVAVCAGYVVITLTEFFLAGGTDTSAIIVLMVLVIFSITAKLSAYPLLLLLPILIFSITATGKKMAFFLKTSFIGLIIYLPWIARNIILSGYVVYPLPFIDIIHVDWKMPKNVLLLDYILVRDGPKDLFLTHDFLYLRQLPFFKWFAVWAEEHVKGNALLNLFVLGIAFLSPIFWMIIYRVEKTLNKRLFVVWAVVYAAIWEWIFTSPEYRFGMVFLLLAVFTPLRYLVSKIALRSVFIPKLVLSLLFVAATVHYLVTAKNYDGFYPFAIKDCWLYPLRDKRYFYKNDKSTFAYTTLNNGVKLYLEDSTHECLNVCGPCVSWRYGQIQMRGTKVEDGFRNVKDEVRENFPFVK